MKQMVSSRRRLTEVQNQRTVQLTDIATRSKVAIAVVKKVPRRLNNGTISQAVVERGP